jgi:hypothetical protein
VGRSGCPASRGPRRRAAAPDGTVTASELEVAAVTAAVVPSNFTTSLDAVAEKFAPLMVTEVPTAPDVGEKLEMPGPAAAGAKFAVSAMSPFTVTVKGLAVPVADPLQPVKV